MKRKFETDEVLKSDLPFSFSSFVLLNPLGGSANPLGLMSYQSKLARQLLPQFTVLTSKPRYHALLCGIICALNELKIDVSSSSARECEILWGLAQAVLLRDEPDRVIVPLNIRRYNRILTTLKENGTTATLEFAKHRKFGLMEHLNYGVWGFYINPSREWRLVNDSFKSLSPLGNKLGKAFLDGTGYVELIKKWYNGKNISDRDLKKFGELSSLDQEPTKDEKSAWSDVLKTFLNDYERLYPAWTAIWDVLPNVNVKRAEGKLGAILEAQSHFDAAANWLEFAFELCYLKSDKNQGVDLKEIDRATLYNECATALNSYEKTRGMFGDQPLLFKEALSAKDFNDLNRKILAVHNFIQDKKSKSPYISREGKMIQSNSLNCERALKFLPELHGKSLAELKQQLFELYQRDWHFPRAAIYKESFK